jgi:1-acyl-sn-glycerol-3-phosphate acyltransferase
MRILLTAYEYAVFYLAILLLAVICLTWSLTAIILQPVLPRAAGRWLGRVVIGKIFEVFFTGLGLTGLFRFDLGALDVLRSEKALIIASNHPALWDAVMMVSRLPDVACIMKSEIVGNIFLGGGARLARYIRNDSLRQMITMAIGELKGGSHILLFPEGTRTVRQPINPLTGSIGVIACRANAPVQTVLVETDSPFLGKGWSLLKKPPLPLTYRVRLGRRFDPPANSAALMAELEQYFVSELSTQAAAPAASAVAGSAALAD